MLSLLILLPHGKLAAGDGQELQVTLIRLRGGLGGMAQLSCCVSGPISGVSSPNSQPGSLGLLLIENFPGHFWLLGLFHFTSTYYYIFKDTEI